MMSREITQKCLGVILGDLIGLALILWVFDSYPARSAMAAAIIGGTLGSLIVIVGIWRREKSNESS